MKIVILWNLSKANRISIDKYMNTLIKMHAGNYFVLCDNVHHHYFTDCFHFGKKAFVEIELTLCVTLF